jgi:cytochrome b561
LIHLNGVPATLAHHIHIITAFILMAIVGLHVMGALKNHFVDRNNVLRKMLGLAPHPVGAARSTD